MTAGADDRVRLTVLGGYLGSGKTTWLRHQLHAGAYAGSFVIVNEAAATPVDDALLRQSARLAVLAGGCCCCDGRPQLVALLRDLCDARSRLPSSDARLKRIVLETSGLADPAPIVEAIRGDKVLISHIVVSEVIVVVDAVNGLSELMSEPLGRRQVETADRFVVAKIDCAGESETARLLATLAVLNPGAAMSGAIKGSDAPLPAVAGAAPYDLPALGKGGGKPLPFPTRLALGDDADWTAFTVWLSALLHARGDDVVRVKGVVRTPAGRLLVQAVRNIVQAPEILPEQGDGEAREDNTIVVIGRGYRAGALAASLKRFSGAPNKALNAAADGNK